MTETPPQVLVVEDEPQMAEIIAFALSRNGMDVHTSPTAEAAWRALGERRFDAVVLDVMLPGMSGTELCTRLRSHSDIPIIMLSALSAPEERITGLEHGADDYLGKPFSPRELVLRVRALLARSQAAPHRTILRLPGIEVDLVRPRAWVRGVRRDLTDRSADVLRTLAARPGQPVTARELLNAAWETSSPVGGREMVKTAVYRLRRELGPTGADMVRTRRGEGYSLEVGSEVTEP
nr:response regulator transcription factor [Actinomycetales bacterium]